MRKIRTCVVPLETFVAIVMIFFSEFSYIVRHMFTQQVTHTHTRAHTHTHTHTQTHTHIYTHTHIHIHTQSHTHQLIAEDAGHVYRQNLNCYEDFPLLLH